MTGYPAGSSVLDNVAAESNCNRFNSRLEAVPTGHFINLDLPDKRLNKTTEPEMSPVY
jgi:hypothetical protein